MSGEGGGALTGSGKGKQSRKATVAIVVLASVTIVLSGVSLSYWSLSGHYYDAKYRAQYVAVSALIESADDASRVMLGMVEPSNIDIRSSASVDAFHILNEACAFADTIRAMYPSGTHENPLGSNESQTFGSVGTALAHVQTALYEYGRELENAKETNTSFFHNSGVNSSFVSVSGLMNELTDLVSAGINQDRNPFDDPYSLVKRMDLVAITDKSNELFASANDSLLLMSESAGSVVAG